MDKEKDEPTPPDNSSNNKSENPDYYFDEKGLLVFTAAYHLKRGYCCNNGCRHCPYGFKK